MGNALFANLDRVHATESAAKRIGKNMGIPAEDAVLWCKRQMQNPDSITRGDKHWKVRGDGFVITVDVESFLIVTARREKPKKGGVLDGVYIIKKLDDIPELKSRLVDVFATKTHRAVSRYGLLLADHLLQSAHMAMDEAVLACYRINQRWQDGDAGFQEARDAAGALFDLAREERNPVKEKALRAMGQVAAIPHVKRHALIASDYAVKVVNLQYPGDFDSVRKERDLQIALMESVR